MDFLLHFNLRIPYMVCFVKGFCSADPDLSAVTQLGLKSESLNSGLQLCLAASSFLSSLFAS